MKELSMKELQNVLGGVISGAGGPRQCPLPTFPEITVVPGNGVPQEDAPAKCD